MPVSLDIRGLYVTELAYSPVHTIVGVPTSVAVFVDGSQDLDRRRALRSNCIRSPMPSSAMCSSSHTPGGALEPKGVCSAPPNAPQPELWLLTCRR